MIIGGIKRGPPDSVSGLLGVFIGGGPADPVSGLPPRTGGVGCPTTANGEALSVAIDNIEPTDVNTSDSF